MPTAVCPGSFDPVTNGHLDIITRAAALFDEVTVAVLVNPAKSGLFPLHDRLEMLRQCVSGLANVTVASFEGLLVDFCADRAISVIVRGIRGFGDVEHELQMAQMNRRLSRVETVLLPASPHYSFLASSLLKEVAAYGGDVAGLVPDDVLARIKRRLEERSVGQ